MWQAKSHALDQIYQVERTAGRQAQFEAFCLREGKSLEDFATWCAIAEEYKGLPWPRELDSPLSTAVTAWRDEHSERVLFHAWLQWVCDEQLERAQANARSAQMSIGIMTDLAVGVHPEGADAWALQRVLARGMSVGAPPDMYNQQGQNWNQPPWQPRALEAAAYIPFRDLVRAAVRHCGALRIDHVIGMFRQWWIAAGSGASRRRLRAVRSRGADRHRHARSAPRGGHGDRGGPRHGGAVGQGLSRVARHSRHRSCLV